MAVQRYAALPIRIAGNQLQFGNNEYPIHTVKRLALCQGSKGPVVRVDLNTYRESPYSATYRFITKTAKKTDQLVHALLKQTKVALVLSFTAIRPKVTNGRGSIQFESSLEATQIFTRYLVPHLFPSDQYQIEATQMSVTISERTAQGTDQDCVDRMKAVLARVMTKVADHQVEKALKDSQDTRFAIDYIEQPLKEWSAKDWAQFKREYVVFPHRAFQLSYEILDRTLKTFPIGKEAIVEWVEGPLKQRDEAEDGKGK